VCWWVSRFFERANVLIETGQTGLGKSTLINTIFASHLIDSKGRLTPDEPARATTEIQTLSHGMKMVQRLGGG
jgi:predicted GTPase